MRHHSQFPRGPELLASGPLASKARVNGVVGQTALILQHTLGNALLRVFSVGSARA